MTVAWPASEREESAWYDSSFETITPSTLGGSNWESQNFKY